MKKWIWEETKEEKMTFFMLVKSQKMGFGRNQRGKNDFFSILFQNKNNILFLILSLIFLIFP